VRKIDSEFELLWLVNVSHTGTTVIRALGTRETTLGPTVRGTISVEKGVFLLETEPRDVFLGGFHRLVGVMAVVGSVRGAVAVVCLCEDENVVTATERVFEDGSRAEVHVGIVTRGLVCG
jgi:hypothetical protein